MLNDCTAPMHWGRPFKAEWAWLGLVWESQGSLLRSHTSPHGLRGPAHSRGTQVPPSLPWAPGGTRVATTPNPTRSGTFTFVGTMKPPGKGTARLPWNGHCGHRGDILRAPWGSLLMRLTAANGFVSNAVAKDCCRIRVTFQISKFGTRL